MRAYAPLSRTALALILGLALVKLALHLWVNAYAGYGYFRDELYYLACASRLDWGYVDQPPFSVWILALNRALLGDSLFALRLLPAIAGALNVVFTGLLVREMGGDKRATALACVAVLAAPIHMAMNGFYSMNAWDMLLWTVAAWLVMRTVRENRLWQWIVLGIVLGVGLLNKVGFMWLGAGFLVGLLVTSHRRLLLTPRPWLAAGIALLFFLPYVIWNALHDFAHLEFMENALRYKYAGITRLDFLAGQLLLAGPSILLWIPALIFFLGHHAGRPSRIVGMIFLTTLFILLVNGKSKPEYLGAAYPIFFAGGAVLLVQWLATKKRHTIPLALLFLLILGFGMVAAPLALPMLPAARFIAYQKMIGLDHGNSESKEMGELPQFFADMHGWEEMAQTVSGVYLSLPEAERADAVVYASNYGRAGAMDFFAKKYPLPRVISPHNSYWIWGYGATPVRTVLIIGGRREDHLQSCLQVEPATTFSATYVMPYENHLEIFICRELTHSMEEIWQSEKHFE